MRVPLLHRLYGVHAAAMAVLFLLLIGVPLVLCLPGLERRRRAGRIAVRAWLLACGAPLRVAGLSRLPAGPCIVVSNHASYVDGPLMMAALPPRFTFVVQHGAADWPIAGRVLKAVGASFVERDSKRSGGVQLRGLLRRLQGGESLVVFPEGTFEAKPALLPFHSGAFLLAARTGVPVVPAVIRGTRRFFPEAARLPRPARLEIELFEPILVAAEDRLCVARARDAARAVILQHCGEPDAADCGAFRYPSPP